MDITNDRLIETLVLISLLAESLAKSMMVTDGLTQKKEEKKNADIV